MTTLTDTITRELLDAVDKAAELDAVLKKHSHSKGPLYHAVARATARLIQQLSDAKTEFSQVEARRNELQDHKGVLEDYCRQLEAKGQSLQEKTRQAEANLVEVNELLDQAKALRGLGFGLHELTRLRALLVKVAALLTASSQKRQSACSSRKLAAMRASYHWNLKLIGRRFP